MRTKFGTALSKALDQLDLSQTTFAEELEISPARLNKLINGQRDDPKTRLTPELLGKVYGALRDRSAKHASIVIASAMADDRDRAGVPSTVVGIRALQGLLAIAFSWIRFSPPKETQKTCPYREGDLCHFEPIPDGPVLNTPPEILALPEITELAQRQEEGLSILTLDKSHRLLQIEEIASPLQVVGITPGILFQNASIAARFTEVGGVILVHNHPNCNLEPSDSDMRATAIAIDGGEMIGYPLLDHCIVSGDGILSMHERCATLWNKA